MIRMYAYGKFGVGRVVLRKALATIGGLSAFGLLGGMVYAFTQDVSSYAPGLGEALSHQSQHNVSVEGPIELDLAAQAGVWVNVHNIKMAPKSGEAYGVRITKARALVRLKPLFSRHIEIDKLVIDGGVFETDSSVTLEDAFQRVEPAEPMSSDTWAVTALRRMSVNNSAFRILSEGEPVFQLPINNASAEPGVQGLELKVDGLVEGRRVQFEGKSGPLTAFMAGHRVYLNGVITSESASLTLAGSIADPSTHGIEFLARGEAENLNDVATLFGLSDLERTSAMKVSAHIKASTSEFAVRDLALTYGRGDVGGWLSITSEDGVTAMEGELVSEFLDLEAFEGGRFLHPPQKLFPDSPFPVKLVQSLKGELTYRANTILLANAKLVDGQVSMVASGGVVALNPIAITYDDGSLDASVVLDAQGRPEFKGTATLSNFNLGKLLSAAKMTDEVEARLDFGGRLRGQGDTVAEMFANASGQTNLIMGKGRLSSEILAMFGGKQTLGITPEVEADLAQSDGVDLDCVVSRFDVIGGIAKSRAFLMETADSVTTGRGNINLGTETLDLRLVPRPKNPAYLKSAVDLRVTGTFVAPQFRVDKKKMSRGIAGSLGRFALAREGNERLLPLIDLPATQSNACIAALTGRKAATQQAASRVYSLTMLQ